MGAKPLRKLQATKSFKASNADYSALDQLNGEHPWMKTIPEGYVGYRVRELKVGEIAYFNYALAKEMGLISSDHPSQLTTELKNKLIDTFSLQIINEYDEISKRKIDPKTIKPNKYMASRYLQLQHSNKQGKTSGDGRGIWNGIVEHRGRVWDVSSRGTGVTCLAPGAVEANRPLKTGVGEFGYGCGLAEIDELYGASILAEVMHLQGVETERVLCVIDLGKGFGIGVRAAPNLLRPAHLFMYLKQNRYDELKNGVDYFIERQKKNNQWPYRTQSLGKYDDLAEYISQSFAKFTAQLDIDYIFAWLDWDGDNVLMNAGIIDYGSVRQFGLRHDQYRYDDVERFSTNLNEQRTKARLLVQVFAQLTDYLKTKKKRPLKDFAKHPSVLKFNERFSQARAERLLYRMGFNQIQRTNILKRKDLFEQFDQQFSFFEKAKISGSKVKVPDGVNHPALFNMRSALRTLPEHFRKNGIDAVMKEEDFFKLILSSFAKRSDMKLSAKHRGHIQNFLRLYKELVITASDKQKPQVILRSFCQRAEILNREDRITGNALIQMVDEIVASCKKGMNHTQVQSVIDQLILSHLDTPEVDTGRFYERKPRALSQPELYARLLDLVAANCEEI